MSSSRRASLALFALLITTGCSTSAPPPAAEPTPAVVTEAAATPPGPAVVIRPSDEPDECVVAPAEDAPAAKMLSPQERGGPDDALARLAKSQRDDGSWDGGSPTGDVGATATVALSYLGFGVTHQTGEYKRTLKNALRYLKNHQRDDGRFLDATTDDELLANLLATATLLEAYGVTGSRLFKDPAERAARSVVDDVTQGTLVRSDDPVVTLWRLLVLRSAKMAELLDTEAATERLLRDADLGLRYGADWSALRLLAHAWTRKDARETADRGLEDRRTVLRERPTSPADARRMGAERLYLHATAMFVTGDTWQEWRDSCRTAHHVIADAAPGEDGVAGARFGPAYRTALVQIIEMIYWRYDRVAGTR